MNLIETLTVQQKIDMLNGTAVGIFPTMVLSTDPFYDLVNEMCIGYYTMWSGMKTISPTYEQIISLVTAHEEIVKNEDELMGSLIRSKFINKWTRIFEALVSKQYDILNNKEWSVIRTGNNRNVDTYNSDKSKVGTNTDNTEYGSTITSDGNVGTKETTTRQYNGADDVYGFNSSTPVGDSTATENTNETVEGDYEHNRSHNVEARTGTDVKTFGINENEEHRGTDTTDTIINENLTRNGRDGSGANLIIEELDMRSKKNFFDIVYKDIDSVLTIPIYI